MINKWVRRIHRWLVIPFTIAFVLAIVMGPAPQGANAQPSPAITIVGIVAVGSLITFFFTGVYMFLQPYVATWQRGRRNKFAKS